MAGKHVDEGKPALTFDYGDGDSAEFDWYSNTWRNLSSWELSRGIARQAHKEGEAN